MEKINIDNNYGVIGEYKNELYLFYKKDNKICYNKIKYLNEIEKTYNYKIYNIECFENLYFENIIINRRIYSSIMNINNLCKISNNILYQSYL